MSFLSLLLARSCCCKGEIASLLMVGGRSCRGKRGRRKAEEDGKGGREGGGRGKEVEEKQETREGGKREVERRWEIEVKG